MSDFEGEADIQQTAWQPPISNLSHRDASDNQTSLPFPASESWSKLLSFEHSMYSLGRVAACSLAFFLDLRLWLRIVGGGLALLVLRGAFSFVNSGT
jgi:hypothetical protein